MIYDMFEMLFCAVVTGPPSMFTKRPIATIESRKKTPWAITLRIWFLSIDPKCLKRLSKVTEKVKSLDTGIWPTANILPAEESRKTSPSIIQFNCFQWRLRSSPEPKNYHCNLLSVKSGRALKSSSGSSILRLAIFLIWRPWRSLTRAKWEMRVRFTSK